MLAATLRASYGIYGPAFELGEHAPREPGSEEYLDSEKYQQRHLGPRAAGQRCATLHRAREPHPPREPGAAAQRLAARSTTIDNDQIIGYSKRRPTAGDAILVVVNLDPTRPQAGWVRARRSTSSALDAGRAVPGRTTC